MTQAARREEIGAAATSLALAAVAGLALWQAREFSAFGSIFPIVIASALLVGSLVVLVRSLVAAAAARSAQAGPAGASTVSEDAGHGTDHGADHAGLYRSFTLIAVLVAWVGALEWTGFLVTSAISFFVLALIADAERPTPARAALYAGVAFAVVGGLQLLFQYGLKVRLPEGELITRLIG